MGRKPLLSDEIRAEMRVEFETTPISLDALARKYNIGRTSMQEWAAKHGWVRYKAPALDEHLGRESAEQLEADVKAAEQQAENIGLARGISKTVGRTSKPAKVQKRRKPPRSQPSDAPPLIQDVESTRPESAAVAPPAAAPPSAPPADRPEKPVSPPDAPAAPPEPEIRIGKPAGVIAGAEIIQFPGTAGAPPPPQAQVLPEPAREFQLPVRDREAEAVLRIQLAALRGRLMQKQMARLGRLEKLIEDYAHLWQLYLTPHEFVPEGMPKEEAQEYATRIHRAAAVRLFPTERDTLAGGLKTLESLVDRHIEMERKVAGIRAPKNSDAAEKDEEEGGGEKGSVEAVDMESLRGAKRTLEALTARRRRNSEPPIPPAPEPFQGESSADPEPGGDGPPE